MPGASSGAGTGAIASRLDWRDFQHHTPGILLWHRPMKAEALHPNRHKYRPLFRHREAAFAAVAIQKQPHEPVLPGLLCFARNDERTAGTYGD